MQGSLMWGDGSNYDNVPLRPNAGQMLDPDGDGIPGVGTDKIIQGPGNTYSPTNPHSTLSKDVQNSFTGGTFKEVKLTQNTTFYRVYGGDAKQVGGYMSRTPQNGGMQSQIDLALDPKWGNTVQNVTTVRVPAGTVIYEGTAAPQVINSGTGTLAGGGNQIYIPEVNPAWFK